MTHDLAAGGLGIEVLALIAGIFLIAGIVKGILGFGLPLIVMALLPLILPVTTSIILAAVVQPFTNFGQLISAGNFRRSVSIVWPVAVTLVIGVALGVKYLTGLGQQDLLLVVGITIIAFCSYTLAGGNVVVPIRHSLVFGLAAGLIAGVLGALTAINGAIFVMYLVGLGLDRQTFRSAIALLFIISALFISSGFYVSGILEPGWALLGVACALPSFAGMWIGNRIGESFPSETFRRIILFALLVTGANLVARGLGLF